MAERTNKSQGTSQKPAAGNKRRSGGKKKRKSFRVGTLLLWSFVAAAMAAVCALGIYIFVIINGHTILNENIDKLNLDEATYIYDNAGNEVGKFKVQEGNRELVEGDEIPKLVREAFIATEDKRFEEHSGIDLFGIGRALVKDIIARSMVEGGSTITQQLAKNLFLNADKTFFRKATEMSIAVALEDRLSKDEILDLYLNRIYFGNGAYGIKSAARFYFDQANLNELELWQIATLAAIPKAPNTYNPIANPEKSAERRAVVLRLMTDQGYITELERASAAAEEYVRPEKDETTLANQAFIDYVLKEAQDMYGLEEDDIMRKGYKIYTTIDLKAQTSMEAAYAKDSFFQKDGPEQKMQSSMIILDNKDGGIVAMVGGRDYVARGLNRATDPRAARQPGSSFKTLVSFAPAIEKFGYNPYTLIPDEKRSYNGYSPRNYDNVYRGQVTMMEAVKRSINAPAVYLLNEVKVANSVNFLKNMGIELDPQDNNLAIALGGLTRGVTPLQMAQAYTAFPNHGVMQQAHSITRIENSGGEVIAEFKPENKQQVMSEKTAWYMTLLLQNAVSPGGTGAAARFERPVAGKTGSTQEVIKGLEKYNRDLWFVGFTPEWTAAVWMGFEKPDSKHYVTISSGAPASLFKEVMQKGLAGKPASSFKRPSGVPDLEAPPKAISDLQAEFVPSDHAPYVRLSWSSVGSNISYQIFRKESGDGEFPSAPLQETAATELRDITVAAGHSYDYSVIPVNKESGLTGQRSNVATVQVAGAEEQPADPFDPLDPLPGFPDNEFPDEEDQTDDPGSSGGHPPSPGQTGGEPGTGEETVPGNSPDSTVGPPTGAGPNPNAANPGRGRGNQGRPPAGGAVGGNEPGAGSVEPEAGTGAGSDTSEPLPGLPLNSSSADDDVISFP